MKTIGIIGAMNEEITSLQSKMEIVTAKQIVGTDFYMGKMHAKSVVLARCGIGKVNAAICTQVLIDLYGVDYVINTGVAGAMHGDLKIGDIVVSEDLVQHDFNSSAFTENPPGVIPRMSESFFKADPEMVRIALAIGGEIVKGNKVVSGRIASGDQFIAYKEDKERISRLFKPYCVEMEGAAIAHTAYLNKIPFVVIRAMSDSADGNAQESFDQHKDQAAENAAAMVEAMVKAL